MVASGFIDRFKGKFTGSAGSFYVQGVVQSGPLSVQTASSTATTQGGTSSGSTIVVSAIFARINAASTALFIRLPAISYIGQQQVLEVYGGSTKVWITGQTSSGITFNGSTYNTMASTVNITISLEATSTINWAITGTYTTSATAAYLQGSTST